jgi:hypothetical protein
MGTWMLMTSEWRWMPSSKNLKKGFRSISNAWTNCFGRAKSKTWSRRGDSWPDWGQKSENSAW